MITSYVILAVLALLLVSAFLALFIFLIWKRYFAYKRYKFDGVSIIASESDSDSFDGIDCTAIPVECLEEYVKKLREDGGLGFTKEFEEIELESNGNDGMNKQSFDQSFIAENKLKNRYTNIVAYDHSRVVLRHLLGHKHSDYINANFVDGFRHSRAYIATQGPLPNTFCDFWRMVWEQRCSVIVMITNVVERGLKKCDQYWPSEGDCNYGGYVVRLISEYSTAFYVVRMMTIRVDKAFTRGADRLVAQYHYTQWPDHGVPDCTTPVLNFVRKSSAANRDESSPIIVHCSAGVGRSGTYIVIDAMLKQMKAKRSVNIRAFLDHIRRQRNFLVQTEAQYIFCYEAILEAYKTNLTEISISELKIYSQSGTISFDKSNEAMIDYHYKLITNSDTNQKFFEANKPYNWRKNRNGRILTSDQYRVNLTLKPGQPGTDYINATFFSGFKRYKENIVTQYPLPLTVDDFWRMIWEYSVNFIILLSTSSDEELKCTPQFWPTEASEPIRLPTFDITLTEAIRNDGWRCYDMIICLKERNQQSTCRLLQYAGWPDVCESLNDVWQPIHWVQEWQAIYAKYNHRRETEILRQDDLQKSDKEPFNAGRLKAAESDISKTSAPSVILDLDGSRQASLFSCLMALNCQLEHESCADVYQVSKLCWQRRPNIWLSRDDYAFLYKCIEYLSNTDSNSESRDMTIGSCKFPDMMLLQRQRIADRLKNYGSSVSLRIKEGFMRRSTLSDHSCEIGPFLNSDRSPNLLSIAKDTVL